MQRKSCWQRRGTCLSFCRFITIVLMVQTLGIPQTIALPSETLIRASLGRNGTESNGSSDAPSLSADGRFVAFVSTASNLVPNDINRRGDIFLYDRQTGTTVRISADPNGANSSGRSSSPSLSADGRFVAYISTDSNLVPDDLNRRADVFLYDRHTSTTIRISLASDGSNSNHQSFAPSINADGRFVAFTSIASNLTPQDNNGGRDIFRYDRQTGTTILVSRAFNNSHTHSDSGNPSINADGNFIAFNSRSNRLIPGDNNGVADIFVRDHLAGITTSVSVASDGTQGNGHSTTPSINADGRFVAFTSAASNLVPDDLNRAMDVFVHDRVTATTSRVSLATNGTEGNGDSTTPSISADGRFVAFASAASNLVPDDFNRTTDVFIHDRLSGATTRVSIPFDGSESNANSFSPSLNADGRIVAFASMASNLTPVDMNNNNDIFVYAPSLCDGLEPTILGTHGNDFLVGTDADDVISGLGGDDIIYGGGGNDVICGGNGHDLLKGDAGNDRLFGEVGDDTLEGGPGADYLAGGFGRDMLFGETDNDQLIGDTGNDYLNGGDGDDLLRGEAGYDILYGEAGQDRLAGQAGNDYLNGGDGNDLFQGGSHSDTCEGTSRDPGDTAQDCERVVNAP